MIKKLKLNNFRNYQDFQISFDRINVLIGANGIGKTNIVEAISILSYAKSFRAHDERHLIYNNKNYAQIKAWFTEDKDINFVITKNGQSLKKEVKIGDIKKNLTDLIGKLKIVLFTPESLRIITGPPSERRKFIDIVASQTDSKYLKYLMRYRHVVRQKNQLLKSLREKRTSVEGLSFWNKELIKCARYITKKRVEIINCFKVNIQSTYPKISHEKDGIINVVFEPRISDVDKIEEIVYLAQEREIEAQKTLYGPHLDDIKFLIDDKPISDIGSRGEIRSVIFCIKLAEIDYIEKNNQSKDKVLLLLDDIFSELDKERRSEILKLIDDRQTIITTTEKELVDIESKKIKFINLENYGQT